jgi:hypothetical protein
MPSNMPKRNARSRFLQIIALSSLVVLVIVFAFQLNKHEELPIRRQDEREIELPDEPPENETLTVAPQSDAPGEVELEELLPEIVGESREGYRVKFPELERPVLINPYANVLNRPKIVVPNDDYLGSRPHVDTEVDSRILLQTCRGSAEKLEYMRNTSRCMNYLASQTQNYTFVPPIKQRASQQDPHNAEYNNADGHGNTNDSYLSIYDARPANSTFRGTCPGPIIPYHVYWRGPATWRVELFIKSYLYTQNLPCSQLNLWLDTDPYPNAVYELLNNDPLFARFIPLVERGDIVVKAWHFPHRIPIPSLKEDDPNWSGRKQLKANKAAGRETQIAPNIVEDHTGQRFLTLSSKQMSFLPVAVSDAVRFVVLHMFGGIYFDMDVLMLRDMRPIVLPSNHSFAERWAQHVHSGGYNTAILSMTANSSLSTYFLRGGVSMGLNFHPLVLGIMARKDGRNKELAMFEHALFDPLWTDYAGPRDGKCIVPCHEGDYSLAFKSSNKTTKGEWQGYEGVEISRIGEENTTVPEKEVHAGEKSQDPDHFGFGTLFHSLHTREAGPEEEHQQQQQQQVTLAKEANAETTSHIITSPNSTINITNVIHRASNLPIGYKDSIILTPAAISFLHNESVIAEYDASQDKYPATNRTLENFYRGAYTYHIHNQWSSHPEPNSWLSVVMQAQDGFFVNGRMNPYGERWNGPDVVRYNLWPEFF